MSKRKFGAILFDLDGTLLDTLADLANSMNATLEKLGFAVHPIDAYRHFVGDGVAELTKRALPKDHQDSDTLKLCLAEYRRQYARRWADDTKPYEGIPELLRELDRRGMPRAVLSNKPHEFTVLTVEKLLPGFGFDIVRGAGDNVREKPDPSGALQIAQEMGIAAENFLYVGDTNTDMQTAAAAGMYPVGAMWGFRDADELIKSGAKTLVKTPMEILSLLEK